MTDEAKETTPAEELNPQDIDFSRNHTAPPTDSRKEQSKDS